MYSTGSIVYGVDLQSGTAMFKAHRAELRRFESLEISDQIIDVEYNGGGESPMYFGVSKHGIACIDSVDGADLITKLQPAQYNADYQQKLVQLDAAVADGVVSQALADAIKAETPKVFITWGSS